MEVRNLFTSSFDMIRFYLKSVLFILLIITILMVLNRLYISTDRYLTYNKTKDFLNISEGYDFVNFGTSHAQFAIDYSTVYKKGFNFALPSQPLLYDNALLSEYNDKF
ncbi:MAG: hypothetical protein C0601_10420 [Candidatus Muiribacterium halophilum]|uniref:Uncharacterized protein n=1 Tax=Muiribacterium halophilum TaxID=2053465 RepID=A0A2N5ZCP0_MUIH1|nr:MAG: hypothetical protein C0601_10420 [Candidatus Muirbacterium halophilum]